MLDIAKYQRLADDISRNTAKYAGPEVNELHPSYANSRKHHADAIVALVENQNALEDRIVALAENQNALEDRIAALEGKK